MMTDEQKEKHNAYMRKWNHKNPEKVRIAQRKQYARPVYRERRKFLSKLSYKTKRLLVIDYYSKGKNCCECCGEKEFKFLALDHIDKRYGTGSDHRKKNGTALQTWIITNNFPEGFRILCHNCNMGRSFNGGICPHKINK